MRGKVLIVDDYSDWRELMSGLMEREGHRIKAHSTREAALDYIAANQDLDLAILDIRLVDTEEDDDAGMDLLAEIRQKLPFARVIMVTGYGTMETQRKAFRDFQAFDFFSKAQFDSDEFRQTCRDAIEQAVRDRHAWKGREYTRGQHYNTWQRNKTQR